MFVLVNGHGCGDALAAGACTAGCMEEGRKVGGHCASEPTLAMLLEYDADAAGKL